MMTCWSTILQQKVHMNLITLKLDTQTTADPEMSTQQLKEIFTGLDCIRLPQFEKSRKFETLVASYTQKTILFENVEDVEGRWGPQQRNIKVTDVWKNEAEFSEFEWGSEDGNEKNLDDI
ncbi:hypothetical protein WA026_020701 [Henosepilachna vigintioctopunctata]|uniref:Uncharacterized protein n=1 Tax=Henosepilachna vigintioctopunctata TaxID=420089 RepID=A0AAW1UAX5_9CUCU